jgi:hypothetical protein
VTIYTITLQSKVCNSGSVRSQVITNLGQCNTILHDHILCANSTECVYYQSTRGTFDTKYHALTILGQGECGACGAVVVEKAVQTCSVDDDTLAVEDPEAERVAVSTEA